MRLEDFGYNDNLEKFRAENSLENFEIGRVTSEHKERFIVTTKQGEFNAEIIGNMRFTAKSREDFPAVGDWVAITTYDSDLAIIHRVLPRFSIIKRQAVGHFGEIQIIATNVDYAFLVQAVDRDYNINRLERYLTICNAARVNPIIVLSKIDLIDKIRLDEILNSIKARIKDIPLVAISNETESGFEAIRKLIKKGKTYCMLGSSGVGKSTLLNNLAGKSIMKTDKISESINRGKHVTSYRELIVLENGGILIDNPGMREVGVADSSNGLETTFDSIYSLSKNCKFKDCTHAHEVGCAVIEAVENGAIDKDSYDNYIKMEREKNHFETSLFEKKRKEKIFGKIIKNYKKDMKEDY